MAVETIQFREIETKTKDMYEATLIVAKRARQIIANRAAEREIEEGEMEPGLLEEEPEINENYEECEKATTVALSEFLDGDLEWSYASDKEENESEETD